MVYFLYKYTEMRNIMKFTKKKTSIIAFMLLLTVVITGISACSNDNSKAGKEVKNAGDLSGAKIGVQLGTTGDIYVSDYERMDREPRLKDTIRVPMRSRRLSLEK